MPSMVTLRGSRVMASLSSAGYQKLMNILHLSYFSALNLGRDNPAAMNQTSISTVGPMHNFVVRSANAPSSATTAAEMCG
jgi:hypothetical protein